MFTLALVPQTRSRYAQRTELMAKKRQIEAEIEQVATPHTSPSLSPSPSLSLSPSLSPSLSLRCSY